MNAKTFLLLALTIVFYSCKKDSTSPVFTPLRSQARATDIFGHLLPAQSPCLKKMEYLYGNPNIDDVLLFTYNADGLLNKVNLYESGFAQPDSFSFGYDSQNRLDSISDRDYVFLFNYDSENRAIRLIFYGINFNFNDTVYFSYPSANTIVVNKYYIGSVRRDTIIQDANYSTISYTSWFYPLTLPPSSEGKCTVTVNSSISNPLFPYAIAEYYFVKGLLSPSAVPLNWFSGRNLITEVVYDLGSGMDNEHSSLINYRVNADNYISYVKYQRTTGGGTFYSEYGFEYSCDQ